MRGRSPLAHWLLLSLGAATRALFGVSAATVSPVYVALRQRDGHILQDHLDRVSDVRSPEYGQWLAPEDIMRILAPPLVEQQQVLAWLESYDVVDVRNYGDAIKFKASAQVRREMFGSVTGYTIPRHLQHIVEFVELSASPPRHAAPRARVSATVDNRFAGREALARLYNFSRDLPAAAAQRTASVGVVEFLGNGGFQDADVNALQIWNDQPLRNVSHVVGINEGLDVESELDVQMLAQVAEDSAAVASWYWSSPHWLYAFAVDFYNTPDIPAVVSMSWGWAEDRQCDIIDCLSANLTSQAYVARVNQEFLKLALRGVTVVASSGDAGAPGRTNEDCADASRPVNPAFPASSPYVLSVGATYVPLDNSTQTYTSPLCEQRGCVTSTDERSVQFDAMGWTAGGGFSLYRNHTPWWQADAVHHYLTSNVTLPPHFHRNGRGYPDLSALGHSCPTIVANELGGVDGTSCSAPIVAGLVATLNAHLPANVGFFNPLLYAMQSRCPDCLRDVTAGYNWCTEQQCCAPSLGFAASAGWDPVSGLGTPRVERMLHFLQSAIIREQRNKEHQ